MEDLSTFSSTFHYIAEEHVALENKEEGIDSTKSRPMTQKRTVRILDYSRENGNFYDEKLKMDTMAQLDTFPRNRPFPAQEFIKKLLSKAMDGSSHQKVISLRQLADMIHDIGIEPIFDCILPWIMQTKLRDQDAYFLLKVMDKVLQHSDAELVRHFVPNIIAATRSFLDDNSHSRMKAKEIIYSLNKVIGLEAMIAAIRFQMGNDREYVRDIAVTSMGIMASALGIPAILPFVKSCCENKESLRVHLTGIRMVEEIAMRVGCTLRPHLRSLIEIIEHGLVDEDLEVLRVTILSLAALARAVAPYGYENFRPILKSLFDFLEPGSARYFNQRGGVLIALVKLCTCAIPLMDSHPSQVELCVRSGVSLTSKLLKDPNEETRKIAFESIKALAQVKKTPLCSFLGLSPRYWIRTIWGRDNTLNRKDCMLLAEATIALANKKGAASLKEETIEELLGYRHEYKRIVLEVIEKVLACENTSHPDAMTEDACQNITYLFSSTF